ncbi:MAG: hypothetical protein AB7F35_25930 [Acetobacteraceae bacterium]
MLRLLFVLALPISLSGCFAYHSASPPRETTVVVPPGSTVVCPSGLTPPC